MLDLRKKCGGEKLEKLWGPCAHFHAKIFMCANKAMFKRVSGEIIFNFKDSKLQSGSIQGTLTRVHVCM